MPFKTSDVDKHKKGLNSSQKKKWVKVANGVLDKCISDGGSDKSCAPKAIRIANSKFTEQGNNMKTEMKQIPKKACGFVTDNDSKIQFQLNEENPDEFKFEVVGYSGNVIEGHWYWNNLSIDLDGIRFNKDIYPILFAHDTDKRIGYSDKPKVESRGLIFNEDNIKFLDNEHANSFIKDAKEGFPFESSIRANPTKIEYVPEDTSVFVNGHELKGPGHIWRECEFRENSICVFGYDNKTSVTVFDEDDSEDAYLVAQLLSSDNNTNENTNLEEHMDYKVFMKEHPEEAKRFEERILEDAEKKFSIKIAEYDKQLEDKDAKIKEFSAKVEELEASVKEFEKREMKRAESEAKEFAEKTWNEELKEAGIPERLHVKIKAFVSAESHMGENGFDKEAFAAAVKKELEDWTEFASDEKEPSIQGSGTMGKVKQEEFSDDEADSLAEQMLGLVKVSSLDKE